MHFRINERQSNRINYIFIRIPISIVTSKKTKTVPGSIDCVCHKDLLEGEPIGKKRQPWSPTEPRGGGWQKVAILPFPSPKQVMARGTRPHLERHRPSGSRNGSSCSSPAMREFCPWPQSFHKTSRCFARGSWVTSVSGEDSSRSQSQKHKNLSVL